MATKSIEAGRTSTERSRDWCAGLDAWAAAAIVVGTMIGTGIFLKPSEMAAEGRSVSVVFAAWIAGGLLSLFGAISYAELGAAIPEAGGEYAYLAARVRARVGISVRLDALDRGTPRVRGGDCRGAAEILRLSGACDRGADLRVPPASAIFAAARLAIYFYLGAAAGGGRAGA